MLDKLFFYLAAGGIDIGGIPQPAGGASADKLQDILNLVFAISGSIAVLIIVLAGFRYILSQGNSQDVTKSRNAILYALVGLVVIMSATAIINFVIDRAG